MARSEDTPSPLTDRIELDLSSNFFIKDPNIPGSYVVVEKSAQDKSSYEPTEIGTAHKTRTDYYLYEESVSDMGNGMFEITSKYAIVPPTSYTFDVIQLPYLKFWGLSVVGSGPITIGTSYLYTFLNVQSSEDLKYFSTDGFVNTREKSGTINAACRVETSFSIVELQKRKSGEIDLSFPYSSDSNSYGDGEYNCGYFGNSLNPEQNKYIDDTQTYDFTASNPSPKVKIETSLYAGNIFSQKTYEIIGQVEI